MSGSSNPLIAQKEDSTRSYSGVGLVESVTGLHDAISSGSWIESGLGVLGVGMEVASVVIDPIGTIASYGVGFLIEHVRPLQEALNWVAGDPDQIEAFAKTWDNVSQKIGETITEHQRAVDSDTGEWLGSTADAYKARAADTSNLLAAAAKAAESGASAVRMAAGIVAAVRQTVRDLVAQTVGRLAAWAAEEVFSVGVATPLVAAQAATYVAKTLKTISSLFRKLSSTFAKLKPLLAKLKDVFSDIRKALPGKGKAHETPRSTARKSTDTATHPTSTETRPTSTDTHPTSTDTHPTSTKPTETHDTPTHSDDGTHPSSHSPSTEGKPETTQRAKNDKGVTDQAKKDNPKDTQTPKQVTDCGDPVDAATGEFLLPATDVELPGVLALVLARRHRSSYRFGRWFGPSWSATLDMRVVVEQSGVTFVGEDGILLAYPHTAPDMPVRPLNHGLRWTMSRTDSGEYRVHDPDREITWHFAPDPVLGGVDELLGNLAITAITDRHHNRIRFHYNADGAPIEVSHSGGYRIRVDTADGRVIGLAVLDAAGVATMVREFAYESGELTALTNGVGATTHFTYDSDHRMLSWTDSNGNTLLNTYDESGRVIVQRGNSDIVNAEFDYFTFPDGTGSRTLYTDSLGNTTTFQFDTDLRLRVQIDPTGARTLTDYDADRRPVRVVAPDGAITTYTYTADGDLAVITRPDGRQLTLEYQAHNRPSSVTEADGTVEHREWDAEGNLTATIDAAGVRTEFTHHPTGAVATITESTGAHTVIDVDAAGLPIRVTDPHGALTAIDRDHFGRPVTVTDALGATTTYTWSAEGKLLRRTDPDGHSEVWVWDGEANLTVHADRNNGITRYHYGPFDLLTQRTDPDGATTTYDWDTERHLIAVTNPLGQTWHYAYDPAGQLAAETDYTGATTNYTHDLAGRVETVTPATGVTRHHTYDILGRLTAITADTGDWIRYTHDPVGRVLTAQTPSHTLTFTHTTTGNLASQQLDDQPPMVYQHDPHGRRTHRTTPSGALTTWDYDPTGRVTDLTADGNNIHFTHDQLGRTTGWRIGNISIDRTLTPVGHLTHQQVTAHPANRTVRHDEFTWRPDGYPTTHTVTHENRTTRTEYNLDPIGRVTTLTRNGIPTEQYTYDPLSNITAAYTPPTLIHSPRPHRSGTTANTATTY
ncbi:DUF6531 domain-containing protein [Nocardia arthritidis]|uniref:Type IV secretion protein Rhs n=1 Tax=Nocardia arthritidis TaxID=228602 RepID=A0A6G9YQR6_9NOCA|nr:DUF6531 domain-containing protein [Nocardia arthritidis]QIS15366.1 hypothetical protein F5544_37700 [Nocardia arthritidis]